MCIKLLDSHLGHGQANWKTILENLAPMYIEYKGVCVFKQPWIELPDVAASDHICSKDIYVGSSYRSEPWSEP